MIERESQAAVYVDGILTLTRGCPDLGRLMVRASEHREWLRGVLERAGDAAVIQLLGFGSRRGSGDRVLSRREAEVLGCLREGLTNRQIAGALYISEATVKVHVHRIYEKLGVRNRTEAALATER